MDTATKFKVGDKARVIAGGAHNFSIGTIVTITKLFEDHYQIEDDDDYWWASDAALEAIEEAPAADTKATNPKDAIGSTKLPLDLVPDTLTVMAALAFTEGATKYGAFNWRVAGVRSSIYRAALQRHLMKWWNGEDADPKTGVPHLASVIACAGIVLDATLAGKITDDRPPKVAMSELIDSLEAKVKHLKEMHSHMTPHHHTAKDSE